MPIQQKTLFVPVCDGGCGTTYEGWNDFIPYYDSPADVRNEVDDHEDIGDDTWVRVGDTYWCGGCRRKPHTFAPRKHEPRICTRCGLEIDEHDDPEGGAS